MANIYQDYLPFFLIQAVISMIERGQKYNSQYWQISEHAFIAEGGEHFQA